MRAIEVPKRIFLDRVRIVGVSLVVEAKRLVDMRDIEEERDGRDMRRVRNKRFDITNVWSN